MSKSTAQKKTEMASTVKVVDGKLIMSLPNAQTPVVWQMGLDQAQSAAFTVEEDKKTKTFSLVLKLQDGETQNIAPFEDKQTAIDILMETSSALQNAHGKIQPVTIAQATNNTTAYAPQQDTQNNKLGAILAVLLIILLVGVWLLSASNSIQLKDERLSTSVTSPEDAKSAAGVPVSADDFLSNR